MTARRRCAKSLRLCHCVFQNITQNCINSHWTRLAGVRTRSRKRNETAPAEDRQRRREQDGWEEMKGEMATPTRRLTEEKINDKKQRERLSPHSSDVLTAWPPLSADLILLPPSIHLLFSPALLPSQPLLRNGSSVRPFHLFCVTARPQPLWGFLISVVTLTISVKTKNHQ